MRNFRIIPSLLLKGQGLYKTTRFDSPKYVGDPINTLKLFNDKEVDEILVLDIAANERGPQFEMLEEFASECFIPLCYGGGIRNLDDIEKLFSLGVEKVSLGQVAYKKPDLIRKASEVFGSQSIVVCADFSKNIWGQYVLAPHGKRTSVKVLDYIQQAVQLGAGEIIMYDVDRDGTYKGFNQALFKEATELVKVPLIACGGAKNLQDLVSTAVTTRVGAVAAGSLFVYYGSEKSVLINYPAEIEVDKVIQEELR